MMNKIKISRATLNYITTHVGQNYVGLYLIFLLLQDQKEITLNQLAKHTNLSPRSLIRKINKLESENIIKRIKIKNRTAYQLLLNIDDIEYCEIQEDIINNIKNKELLGMYSRLLISKNYFTHETISNYQILSKESKISYEAIRNQILKLKEEGLIKTIKGHARGVTYFIFPKEENNH